MDNRYTGAVEIVIAGKTHVLRYDWDALAKLKTEFGKDYNEVLGVACREGDTDVLARALMAGLSPAVGLDDIKKASPPLLVVTVAIDTALKYAYFGSKEIPPLAGNPLERPKETLLSSLLRRLFGRESSRASSGA